MKKKTVDLFRSIARQALKPIPKLSVSEWADSFRVISAEGASEPGRWHTSRAPYQKEIMDAFTQYGVHKVVVKSCSQIGKALDIDTAIPTPDGWKKIVDLKNGDKVFDENGKQCKVLWRSEIMENHDCFEVCFSDNTKIVADAEHKWYVEPYRGKPCVLTTRELLKGYKNGRRNIYAIPVAKPLKTETKELLIHPYLLGVWLGDGNSYSAQITIHEKDIEIAEYIKEQGYSVVIRALSDNLHVKNIQVDPFIHSDICRRGHDTRITGLTKDGRCAECHRQISLHNKWKGIKDIPVDPIIEEHKTLRSKLAELNLIGNKHIPKIYLRSDVNQRWELLKGLMDSDGSITQKGRCEITFKSKILIDGVSELLHSLGIKHTVKEKIATCYNSPIKAQSQVWRISFLVYEDTPVFKLKRDLKRQKSRAGCRTTETERRRIININSVKTRPVCCIAVDSPNHLYLAGEAMIPTHNSDIMNNVIGRFAHLAPAPIMMIQPTIDMAQDFSKGRIAPMIRDTKVLSRVFGYAKSRESSNTILLKSFPGGRLIMSGANSPASLASRPVKVLLCDEVDRFPMSAGSEGDPIGLASKRMTTFWDRVMGEFSTPTNAGESRIDDEYMEGTQEEWQHKCPNCGEFHLITHRSLNSDYETFVDAKGQKHVTVKSVQWRCPDCGFSFGEVEMRRAKQKYIPQNAPALANGVRSFFVNCWASPWLSWNMVMQEWLEAKGDPEREKVIYNTRFGESYERKGEFEGPEMFLERREAYGAELPDGVLLLTAAVDVQDNRLEYEICGWGDGEECWGIQKGIILGVPDTPEPWRQLDMQLDRRYYFKNGVSLVVARTFIDSGGHYTNEVYRYCLTHFSRQRIAIKGSSTPGVPIVYKYAKQNVNRKITVPVVLLGTDSGKQYVMDRLSIEVPGPKYFHFPLDSEPLPRNVTQEQLLAYRKRQIENHDTLLERGYDEIYFKGLISEQRIPRKRNGRIVWQWEVIASDKRNEPLDLRVYNLACMLSLRPDWERFKEVIAGASADDMEQKPAPKPKTPAKKRYGCIKRGSLR